MFRVTHTTQQKIVQSDRWDPKRGEDHRHQSLWKHPRVAGVPGWQPGGKTWLFSHTLLLADGFWRHRNMKLIKRGVGSSEILLWAFRTAFCRWIYEIHYSENTKTLISENTYQVVQIRGRMPVRPSSGVVPRVLFPRFGVSSFRQYQCNSIMSIVLLDTSMYINLFYNIS